MDSESSVAQVVSYNFADVRRDASLQQLVDQPVMPNVIEVFFYTEKYHCGVVEKRFVSVNDVLHSDQLEDGGVSFPEAKLLWDDDVVPLD